MDMYSGWTSHFSLLLPHPSEPMILLTSEGGRLALPCVRIDEFSWWRDMVKVGEAAQRALGAHVMALGCMQRTDDFSERVSHRVYGLENCDASDDPGDGVWVGRDTLAGLPVATPEHRSVIEERLDELEGDGASLQPAWRRRGWYGKAEEWFSEQLSTQGYVLTSQIQCAYSWPMSCILRAHTTTGSVYMRACCALPFLADEPALTSRLAGLFPGRVPMPLGAQEDDRWMLLPDLGKPIRYVTGDEKTDALALFAELQLRSVDHTTALLDMGCPDRRPEWLETELDRLIQNGNQPSATTELDQIRVLAPHLKSMCRQLATYRVPNTLSHGDLFGGNIAQGQDGYIFFDWAMGSVSHPFFDAINLCDWEELRSHARDRYLGYWTDYEPMERLREAYALAEPLWAAHNAILFDHVISEVGEGTEVRSDTPNPKLEKLAASLA